MKKIFSFLIIFILMGSMAHAQVTTRGVAASWRGGDPGLRTVGAVGSNNGITFKAFYNSLDTNYSNNDAPIMYVEYGPTGDLGLQTDGRYQAIGNRIEEYTVSGLNIKNTYFYRAVLAYNNKTSYGEVLEYKPTSTTDNTKTTTTTQTTTSTTETDTPSTKLSDRDEVISDPAVPKDVWPWSLFSWFGGSKKSTAVTKPSSKNENGVKLSISNDVTDTGLGQNVMYTISYANTSGKTYSDVDIETLLPAEYEFVSTDKGDYYSDAHSVLVKLYTFEPREKGTINITVKATGKKAQKFAEASAHLYNDAGQTVVYDIDNYSNTREATTRTARGETTTSTSRRSSRSSSTTANPLAGSTMIGWLIIGVIVAGVVFISYRYFKKDKY